MGERLSAFPNVQLWRRRGSLLRLEGDICDQGHAHFPPDDVCKKCDPVTAVRNAIANNAIKMQRELLEREERLRQEREASASFQAASTSSK